MKRSLPFQEKKLGAKEFATILNGDDARPILVALKSFVKIVKRERNQALSDESEATNDLEEIDNDEYNDDDDDDDDDDIEKEDLQHSEKESKKIKFSWMEDSKEYNVPFVGTSVATGDTGRVVRNQWPTGLLEEYLRQSPLAIELTSDRFIPPSGPIHKKLLRQKMGKLSYAIYKAYLEALAELATAAVSIEKLKQLYSFPYKEADKNTLITPSLSSKFITPIMKNRFLDLISILHDETGSGKGKTGAISGVGPLVIPVLRIFTSLAMSSVTISRQIARTLDSSVRNGVLKIIFREPRKLTPTQHEQTVKQENSSGKSPLPSSSSSETGDRLAIPYQSRAYGIMLALALVEQNDPNVNSYISTPGNKERKINAGILYLALRYGLEDSMFRECEDLTQSRKLYISSLSNLLRSLRRIVYEGSHGVFSKRSLADILGADALVNLTQIAACAPPLTSYDLTLKGTDEYRDATLLQNSGIRARRLLFLLLGDALKSPFLIRISGREKDTLSAMYTSFMVKAYNTLLHQDMSMPVQNFIIHALSQVPLLLSGFFRTWQIPDIKHTFKFLAGLRFATRILQEGPQPAVILDLENGNIQKVDRLISVTFPHQLNKLQLNRALQHPNSFVVFEVSKFILTSLRRFHHAISLCKEKTSNDQKTASLMMSYMPDVQSFLSTRAKFNPFVKVVASGGMFVNNLICNVLTEIAMYSPSVIVNTKFDWMKLLPEDLSCFCNAPTCSQFRILETLAIILKCKWNDKSSKPSPKTCRLLIEVSIKAKNGKIYQLAKIIAAEALSCLLDCAHDQTEISFCQEFELSMWIDFMQERVLDEFQSLLEDTLEHPLLHKVNRIHSWKKGNPSSITTPSFSFTLALSNALSKIRSLSHNFSHLIYNLCGRCLLFHSNPVPLAAMIENYIPHEENGNYRLPLALRNLSHSILEICQDSFSSNQCTAISEQADALEKLLFPFNDQQLQSTGTLKGSILSLYLRRNLQILSLLDDMQDINHLKVERLAAAKSAVHALIQHCDFKGLSTVLNHPVSLRGNLPKSLYFLLYLVNALSSGTHVSTLIFETTVANVLLQLSPPGSKIIDIDRYDLLKIWFLNSFLSVIGYNDIAIRITKMVTEAGQGHGRDKLLLHSLALHWARYLSSPLPIEITWEAWHCFTENEEAITSRHEWCMMRIWEKALCNVDGLESSIIFVKICNLGWNRFLSKCLRSLKLSAIFDGDSNVDVSLIWKAINIGCDGLAQHIVRIVQFISDTNEECEIDENAFTLKEVKNLLSTSLQLNIPINAIAKKNDKWLQNSLISMLNLAKLKPHAYLMTKEMKNEHRIEKLVDDIRINFEKWKMGRLTLKSIIEIGAGIGVKKELQCGLLIIIDSLPSALKRAFKEPCQNQIDISFCQSLIEESLEQFQKPDLKITEPKHFNLDSVVKYCLKFGIHNGNKDTAALRISCLKLVRSILTVTSQPEGSKLQDANVIIQPNMIWNMIISHSQFSDALTWHEKIDDKEMEVAAHEIVNLLMTCASLSPKGLSVEMTPLNNLFNAYNGGMSPFDLALRRLFFLIENMEGVKMPCVNEMATRMTISRSMSVHSPEIISVDAVLDMQRVHSTLSQFPKYSLLSPKPLDFEVWIDHHDPCNIQDEDYENLDDNDVNDISVPKGTSRFEASYIRTSDDITDDSSNQDMWRNTTPDLRYDPSFILPLIVSTLQGSAPDFTENLEKHAGGDDFAQLARRLCDKGGLSLLLASLCSNCDSLRKLAFSGLCLFLIAIDSEEAKDLAIWRERPQLKMLLNSVQVGFVLRKSMLNAKGLEIEIPKVPSSSAIFLAKASLILCKPGDAIYSSINKYFLKISQNHGAFNDMTRLPAFISMFCSPSDESPGKERLWALQCLKDGFLGGFHMVASCHAPDLLLTSLWRTQTENSERYLIIQVLIRILSFGGKQASRYFHDKLGLLSLLRAYLIGNVLSQDILSVILDLIEIAVQQGLKYAEFCDQKYFSMEILHLMVPIASLDTAKSGRSFCFLAKCLKASGFNELISNGGLSISQTMQLIISSDQKSDLLEAVCLAPLIGENIDGFPNYCEELLQMTIEMTQVDYSIVLSRVMNFAKSFRIHFRWPEKVVRLVLNLHSRACYVKEYRSCLEAFVANRKSFPKSDDDLKLATLTEEVVGALQ